MKTINCPCGLTLSVSYSYRIRFADTDGRIKHVWEWSCTECGTIFHERVEEPIYLNVEKGYGEA